MKSEETARQHHRRERDKAVLHKLTPERALKKRPAAWLRRQDRL